MHFLPIHRCYNTYSDAVHNVLFNFFMLEIHKEHFSDDQPSIPQKVHKLNLETYLERVLRIRLSHKISFCPKVVLFLQLFCPNWFCVVSENLSSFLSFFIPFLFHSYLPSSYKEELM